jgi:hypothetical protein
MTEEPKEENTYVIKRIDDGGIISRIKAHGIIVSSETQTYEFYRDGKTFAYAPICGILIEQEFQK